MAVKTASDTSGFHSWNFDVTWNSCKLEFTQPLHIYWLCTCFYSVSAHV